jgi:hypothetical protein
MVSACDQLPSAGDVHLQKLAGCGGYVVVASARTSPSERKDRASDGIRYDDKGLLEWWSVDRQRAADALPPLNSHSLILTHSCSSAACTIGQNNTFK